MEDKSVKMPAHMIEKAKAKLQAVSEAQLSFQNFVEGCMCGLGLIDSVSDYSLDVNAWTFSPVEKAEEKK